MFTVRTFQLLALVLLLSAAVVTDLRHRRIPNQVTGPGLAAGLLLAGLVAAGIPWLALAGAGLGLALSFPLFALGVMGAGDAKLIGAVGAYVGVGGILSVLIYTGLAGGILALASALQRRAILGVLLNTKNLMTHWFSFGRHGHRIDLESPGARSIPYGPAIALGALAAWFFPIRLGGF